MHTEGVAHGPSTLFMHTGATNLVRPSMGSWISYGLGTENQNLPAFVTISPSASKGGPRNYSNAFLPSIHQGTAIGRAGNVSDAKIKNIDNAMLSDAQRENRFGLLQSLNRMQAGSSLDDNLEATISNYELAWRMQMEAPELTDLTKETAATKSIYGIDEKHTDDFGKQCLLARRMVERGVRFVSINYSDESANPRWDQHGNMPKHADHARATDKPVAGSASRSQGKRLARRYFCYGGEENLEEPHFLKIRTVGTIIQEVLRFFSLEVGLNRVFHMDQRMKLVVLRWKIECTCMTCMQRFLCSWFGS